MPQGAVGHFDETEPEPESRGIEGISFPVVMESAIRPEGGEQRRVGCEKAKNFIVELHLRSDVQLTARVLETRPL